VDIQGQVALVTGAASGLGQASARGLAAAGATVVVADLDEERGAQVAAELGGGYVRCDVTSEADVEAAVGAAADRGRFAICVHCAGGGIARRTLSKSGTPHPLAEFQRVIDLNLVGTFNVLRLAAAGMSGNEPDEGGERGVCIQTASIAGYEGQIGQIAYGAAKGGVIGMTVIAARELADFGIRVVTIAPGTFATPAMSLAPQEMLDDFAAKVPFPRRLGDPTEFAALARHIVENPYLNGEVIRLDGAVRFAPR